MKKIYSINIIISISLLPIFLIGQIRADKTFFWSEYGKPEWDVRDDWLSRNLFRFFNIDGEMYSVQSRNNHTYLYAFDKDENRFHHQDLVHKGLKNHFDFLPAFDPVLFKYADNTYLLEYFSKYDSHIFKWFYTFTKYHSKDIVDYNRNSWKKDFQESGGDGKEHRIYRSSCTIGDFVYLLYDSYVKDNKLKHVSGGNEIRIAKCFVNDKHELKTAKIFKLEGVMEKKSYHPYASSWFIHPDGSPRMLISYSAEQNNDKENKGGGVIVFNPKNGNYKKIYHSKDYAFSIRAIHGTLKGKRTKGEVSGSKNNGNRIQIIYNHFTDGYREKFKWFRDKGHFYCRTYVIKDNEYKFIKQKEILLTSKDYYPDEWNRMSMDLTYMLESEEDNSDTGSDNISAGSKYNQKLWMFYTDKNGYIRGCKFTSDTWQFIKNSFKKSTDLDDIDKYGDEVKDSWILFGIIEGAPPCPINWEKWDSIYDAQHEKSPSNFTFSLENTKENSFETEVSGSVFIGFTGGGEDTGFEVEGKYTSTWEKQTERKVIETTEVDIPFNLSKEYQKYGYKIYLVPDIARITYGTFPWWHDPQERTLKNATNFQYRFITYRYSPNYIPISLQDSLFNIDTSQINTESSFAWSAQNRQWLSDEKLNFKWISGNEGWSAYNKREEENTIEVSHENEIELSASAGKPDVFSVNFGGNFIWKNSVTTKYTIGKRFSFSYENLKDKKNGPLVSEVSTNVYIYYTPKEEYPYSKHLRNGEKPWYVGYTSWVRPFDDGFILSQSNNYEKNALTTYPNPSNGEFINIKYGSETGGRVFISLIASDGNVIFKKKAFDLSKNKSSFQLQFNEKLNNGIYFMQLSDEKGQNISTRKFVVID